MLLQEGKPKDWADCCASLGAVPAPLAIPIKAICTRARECSVMKSSANVGRIALVPSSAIPVELALSAWHTCLNECWLLFPPADRKSLASHFFTRPIIAPVVRLPASKMLARNEAMKVQGEMNLPRPL
jgi:hypothetical protein